MKAQPWRKEGLENNNYSVMLSIWMWIFILILRQGRLRSSYTKQSGCNLSQLLKEHTFIPLFICFVFNCLEWLNTIHIIRSRIIDLYICLTFWKVFVLYVCVIAESNPKVWRTSLWTQSDTRAEDRGRYLISLYEVNLITF